MVIEREQAEALALQALAYLAEDDERFRRFLLLTGTALADIRARAADPAFLSGVMDHLISDEPLLLSFAEQATLDPAAVVAARRSLPAATEL
ncbi:MAG: DUF3572 domain-containing protein [Alphaproteobacteria bacterium]|nr:DUF3572 domain-containing protein [Alphaproteobacteria bacterium]